MESSTASSGDSAPATIAQTHLAPPPAEAAAPKEGAKRTRAYKKSPDGPSEKQKRNYENLAEANRIAAVLRQVTGASRLAASAAGVPSDDPITQLALHGKSSLSFRADSQEPATSSSSASIPAPAESSALPKLSPPPTAATDSTTSSSVPEVAPKTSRGDSGGVDRELLTLLREEREKTADLLIRHAEALGVRKGKRKPAEEKGTAAQTAPAPLRRSRFQTAAAAADSSTEDGSSDESGGEAPPPLRSRPAVQDTIDRVMGNSAGPRLVFLS